MNNLVRTSPQYRWHPTMNASLYVRFFWASQTKRWLRSDGAWWFTLRSVS